MPEPKQKREYKPGEHPNSQANLNYHGGRPKSYGEEKKSRYLTITESGWAGVQSAAREAGCTSVSDLLEKLGRGQVNLDTNKQPAA